MSATDKYIYPTGGFPELGIINGLSKEFESEKNILH